MSFQKHRCHGEISRDFQFHEKTVNKRTRLYKPDIGNKSKCLGLEVSANEKCSDATLYLIDTKNNDSTSRRCYFESPGTWKGWNSFWYLKIFQNKSIQQLWYRFVFFVEFSLRDQTFFVYTTIWFVLSYFLIWIIRPLETTPCE